MLVAGCSNKLGVEVELLIPPGSNALDNDVIDVRMRALALGEVVTLGQHRWDQGAFDLPTAIDPQVERFVVEGLAADGTTVLSSGATGPLDLLSSPPEGRIQIFFSRIGELSLLSELAPERNGGRAVELLDRRVLFVGGDRGPTEIAALHTLRPGPPQPGERTSAFFSVRVPSGRVVVAGGEDRRIAVLDPLANTTQSSAELAAVRPGAAVAGVSDSLVIIAGGDQSSTVSDELRRFNPQTLEETTPGKLLDARSEASAVVVSGGRVLMIGGRGGGAGDATAERDALVFDPSRGGASLQAIALGAPMIAPAACVTAAGSTIIAGARGAHGERSATIAAVVVQPERAQAFGDTSTVTAAAAPIPAGQLLDLDDGTVLFLPAGEESIQWISLLPAKVSIPPALDGVAGPWIGGRIEDGTVLLRNARGALAIFNPGVASVLGSFDPDLRIIPLRPSAWTYENGILDGHLLSGLPQGVAFSPAELAILGSSELADFQLDVTLELDPLSQAAIAFGFRTGDFDHLSVLGNLALLNRFQAVGTPPSLACTSQATAPLAGTGPHPLHLSRKRLEVRADFDDDGTDDLVCTTPDAPIGRLALGVITGRARFSGIKIRATP